MKELLERWAALEPERCRLDQDGMMLVADDGLWSVVRTKYVQVEVQQAIEARGLNWRWLVRRVGGVWAASVHWSESRFDSRFDSSAHSSRYSPAEAILAAYLEALEAAAGELV